MKNLKYIALVLAISVATPSCKKTIDIDPISNLGADAFYNNYEETSTAMNGCYNGLHEPLYIEWMFTELRGDNAKQGVANSTSAPNIELNELDMFTLNTTHDKVYDYWLSTYKNIRAINYVLRSLGVKYDSGAITVGEGKAAMTAEQKNELAGEALFLRAYHYFNLVRLYGGVFAITEPVDPKKAKQINRNSVEECYQLITADLMKAKELLPATTFGAINSANLGKANIWAAKALLAKVYLTTNQKALALPLLNDVIDNSGYDLLGSYDDVFNIANEMNKEILFAVRYKAGGVGLGSPFANLFAPSSSGNAVVNNDGLGYDYPTESIKAAYITPTAGSKDARKATCIGQYTSTRPYCKKFTSQVVTKFDAENDFPVIRFADVLLMKAEAEGFNGADGSSMQIINRIRQRAGAETFSGSDNFTDAFFLYPATGSSAITTDTQFKTALFKERRLELAFENQRFFDMMRSGDAVNKIYAYYDEEYPVHYKNIVPAITLAELKANVTNDRLLLPIPQREIDTNDQLEIGQNLGY